MYYRTHPLKSNSGTFRLAYIQLTCLYIVVSVQSSYYRLLLASIEQDLLCLMAISSTGYDTVAFRQVASLDATSYPMRSGRSMTSNRDGCDCFNIRLMLPDTCTVQTLEVAVRLC